MKIIYILMLIAGQTMAFEEVNNSDSLLGIMSKEQKIFIKEGVNITRELTKCAKNKGYLQPLIPAEGVSPITEIDILKAMGDKQILIVDMRKPMQYMDSTIPTAINVPYETIQNNLDVLGCEPNFDNWDCSEAKKVYAFCNGPVCSQSPTAIRKMIRHGFPEEKIYYYRGGMFNWEGLGLTIGSGR